MHICEKCCIFAQNFSISLRMRLKEEQYAPMWELSPIWATLTEEERVRVAEQVEIVRYEKNEIIHNDGDESQYVWMLLKGKVRIYKEGIGQRLQIIRLLKPYDIFGYRACTVNEPYNSSASAFEACMVYRLNREFFNELIRQKHIRGRLAESLLLLLKNYGYEEDGQTLAMLLPREDLANMSNMTTSNAIRTLSQFAQEGIVGIDGRHVKILNEKALERISRLG